jgi:hypothetical protein
VVVRLIDISEHLSLSHSDKFYNILFVDLPSPSFCTHNIKSEEKRREKNRVTFVNVTAFKRQLGHATAQEIISVY